MTWPAAGPWGQAALLCGALLGLGGKGGAGASPLLAPPSGERGTTPSGGAALEFRPPPLPWGSTGHRYVSRAAHEGLPPDLPTFFREAGEQLVYLGPEPDRWRSPDLREMNDAWQFDHYIDLENVPEGALDAPDRWEFLTLLHQAGIQRPQQNVGFLPWRILELYQRLASGFARWRELPEGPERRFLEARILNDAGILGHYVADAAQPHHTTIHFNGWAEGVPNPKGFTSDRGFHARFESAFVEAHVTYEEVARRMSPQPRPLGPARQAIWEYVREGNREVERLYELELRFGFRPELPPHPETVAFAAERLAEGAEMLRALWWKAWLESEMILALERERRRR